MTEDEYKADAVKVTPDLILDIYEAAKKAEGKEKKLLLTIAEVLSNHLGEDVIR